MVLFGIAHIHSVPVPIVAIAVVLIMIHACRTAFDTAAVLLCWSTMIV
jgi:hypothetical protein